jgi:hypothetical protein
MKPITPAEANAFFEGVWLQNGPFTPVFELQATATVFADIQLAIDLALGPPKLAVMPDPSLCGLSMWICSGTAMVQDTQGTALQRFSLPPNQWQVTGTTAGPIGGGPSGDWLMIDLGAGTYMVDMPGMLGTEPVGYAIKLYFEQHAAQFRFVQVGAGLMLALTPAESSAGPSGTVQLDASVLGAAPDGWTVAPALGSVTPAGLYTAPGSIAQPTGVVITATAGSQGASAAVVIAPPLTITPSAATLTSGQALPFAVTTGAPATWTMPAGSPGTLGADGTFTTPEEITAKTTVEITAAAAAGSAIVPVTLVPSL